MESLVLTLAGKRIGIQLDEPVQQAAVLIRRYIQGFEGGEGPLDAELLVTTSKGFRSRDSSVQLPFPLEQRLHVEQAIRRIGEDAPAKDGLPLNPDVVAAWVMGGVLLFDPGSRLGRMYLPEAEPWRFQPLYRLLWMYLAQVLAEDGSCFVHGVALARHQEACLFLGESGSGKTTLARTVKTLDVISDDGPVLLRRNGSFCVLASPYTQYRGNHAWKVGPPDRDAALRAVYFLGRDETHRLQPLSPVESLTRMLFRFVHFFDYLSIRAREDLFGRIHDLCTSVPAHAVCFSREPDVVRLTAWMEGSNHGG